MGAPCICIVHPVSASHGSLESALVTLLLRHAEIVAGRPNTYSITRYLFGQVILSVTYERSQVSMRVPDTDDRLERIMLLFDVVEARDGMLEG